MDILPETDHIIDCELELTTITGLPDILADWQLQQNHRDISCLREYADMSHDSCCDRQDEPRFYNACHGIDCTEHPFVIISPPRRYSRKTKSPLILWRIKNFRGF